MGKAWQPSAADLERHRRDFPSPPARFATVDVVFEDVVAFVGLLGRSKRDALRGLFPDKTDEQIIDALVDDVLERVGLV